MRELNIYMHHNPRSKLKKKRVVAIIIIVIFCSIIATIISYNLNIPISKPSIHVSTIDRFGIKKIYPTKQDGREWYMNTNNIKQDPIFSVTSNIPIKKSSDDRSWFINNSSIRININTPPGEEPWKNVEMTGYVKVISKTNLIASNNGSSNGTKNSNYIINNDNNEEDNTTRPNLDWRARGGLHNNKVPCKGTALNGGIDVNGTVGWKKEIWHTGGYTDAKGIGKATNSILDRWVGWKVVMYNINDNLAVKMESYLDDKNDNNWRKVSDVVDNGGWYAKSSDNIFYSADCGKPKDYIITNGGPIATFRAENMVLNFKNLSIREIEAPA
jgi:hypothetical protein